METLLIGAPFEGVVKTRDGSSFPDAPQIALYSRSTKRCVEVTGVAQTGGGYKFTFPAELTELLEPGVFTLEIYNNDRSVIYERIEPYVCATKGRVSPDTIMIDPSESE